MKNAKGKSVYIKIAKILYVIVFVAIVVWGIWLYKSEAFDQVRPVEEYVFHSTERIPRAAPDILIAEDGKLFLFYIDAELVNVYTDSGDYLYGFQFPDGQNGRSDMCYKNGLLYVDARCSGIYVFQDTQLLRFEEQHNLNAGYEELTKEFTGEEDHTDGEYLYSYVEESNRIQRLSGEGLETVLQFPERRYDPASFGALLLVMVLLGNLLWGKIEFKRT